ncbi:hypothetical protein Pmani_022736 [Petrolisthes manimaculis]|uniref:Uncharacterized protein n=1 Tax=Petrolisthes manimaculis TaxID=1843537 RepID=A0AAE1U451_9EUCA|nr:hypothetical protein Pmani_022736 [Petrolisthes manimaculis]
MKVDVAQDKKVPREHASAPGRGRNNGASSTCAEGNNNPLTNSTLDSPPDQENADPGPKKQRHGAQRNVRNYKTVKWSREEKKKDPTLLHLEVWKKING